MKIDWVRFDCHVKSLSCERYQAIVLALAKFWIYKWNKAEKSGLAIKKLKIVEVCYYDFQTVKIVWGAHS